MNALFGLLLAVAAAALVPAAAVSIRSPLRRLRGRSCGLVGLVIWCLAGVVVASPGLRRALAGGFPGDSLFTLEPAEQAGLIAIAAALIGGGTWLSLWIALRLSRGARSLPVRIARLAANLVVTLGGYAGATILAPQVFYAYYRSIIADLPDQWVVQGSYQLGRLAEALHLEAGASIASITTGVLFWMLAAITLAVHALAWAADFARTNRP